MFFCDKFWAGEIKAGLKQEIFFRGQKTSVTIALVRRQQGNVPEIVLNKANRILLTVIHFLCSPENRRI